MTGTEAQILLDEAVKYRRMNKAETAFRDNVIKLAKLSVKQAEWVQLIYAMATGGGRYQRRVITREDKNDF